MEEEKSHPFYVVVLGHIVQSSIPTIVTNVHIETWRGENVSHDPHIRTSPHGLEYEECIPVLVPHIH